MRYGAFSIVSRSNIAAGLELYFFQIKVAVTSVNCFSRVTFPMPVEMTDIL